MSTRDQLSLIPIAERLPEPTYKTPHGNYRTSAFTAFFKTIVGEDLANVVVIPTAANPIPCLLFMSDFAAILIAQSLYIDIRFTVVGGGGGTIDFGEWPPQREDIFQLGNVVGGDWPTLITNPEADGVDAGSDVQGTTFTGEFQVSGMPVEIDITDANNFQLIAGGAALPFLELIAISQSELIDGPVSNFYSGANTAPLGPNGGDFPGRVGVILEESAYTEEIRDNNNQFIDSNGGIAQVVGIFFNSQP